MMKKFLFAVVCGAFAFGAFSTSYAQSAATGVGIIKTEKYVWKPGDKSAGGEMKLKYFDGGMVSADITTMVDTHDCAVEIPKRKLKNNVIEYAEKDEDTGEMCKVRIKLMEKKASVTSENCHSFCGLRGYFDGKYIRK